jgi:DNA-binding transcriptional ArsR family regulator
MGGKKTQENDRGRSIDGLIDGRLIRTLNHPLRVRILSVLNERTSSPSDLSEELNASLSDTAYHVKQLLEAEQIELVRTAQRRGAVEHYYRGVRRALIPPDAWKRLPESVQAKIAADTYELLFKDANKALEAQAYTKRPDSHVSWTPMTLDPEGWEAFVDLLAETLDRGLEIQAQASSRLAEAGPDAKAISVTMGLAGFESTREPKS